MTEAEFGRELDSVIRNARESGLEDGAIARCLRSTAHAVGKAWDAELNRRNARRIAENNAMAARQAEERARRAIGAA